MVRINDHKKIRRVVKTYVSAYSVSVPEVISVAEKLRKFQKRGLRKEE